MTPEFITDRHGFKNKVLSKIDNSKLAPDMKRTRSGRTQIFRRDYDNKFANKENADVVIEPPKRSYYSHLIGQDWYWVEGCYECNGEKRDWMCYVECTAHDRCSACNTNRKDIKDIPWGGKNGWTCKPCQETKDAIELAEALAKMPKYDRYDYLNLGTIKCPNCGLEYDYSEAFEHHEAEDDKLDCVRCKQTFLVTAEKSLTFTMEKC